MLFGRFDDMLRECDVISRVSGTTLLARLQMTARIGRMSHLCHDAAMVETREDRETL